jgi:hypothetical protein
LVAAHFRPVEGVVAVSPLQHLQAAVANQASGDKQCRRESQPLW